MPFTQFGQMFGSKMPVFHRSVGYFGEYETFPIFIWIQKFYFMHGEDDKLLFPDLNKFCFF